MCMQDLAIDRRVTVRQTGVCPSEDVGGTQVPYLPPNPRRIWAMSYVISTGSIGFLSLKLIPTVTSSIPLETGASGQCRYVSIHRYPGIFSENVYSTGTAGDVGWIEAVYDTDLDLAVQAINQSLSKRGG